VAPRGMVQAAGALLPAPTAAEVGAGSNAKGKQSGRQPRSLALEGNRVDMAVHNAAAGTSQEEGRSTRSQGALQPMSGNTVGGKGGKERKERNTTQESRVTRNSAFGKGRLRGQGVENQSSPKEFKKSDPNPGKQRGRRIFLGS